MKAVFIALFAAMVGCTFVQPIMAADAVTFREKVLYSFCSQKNCKDGKTPTASLIYVSGTLYGTASRGGRYIGLGCDGYGCGTAFALDPNTGAETVLYAFCSQPNCADGWAPQASLISVNGSLYGTTYSGGTGFQSQGYGTAFSLDPNTGAEKVLYSFCQQQNCPDGLYPDTSLIDVNGTLYGTTQGGGNGNDSENGTAYAIDLKTGTEKVFYDFCSEANCTDGEQPRAALIAVNGTLYGTTLSGGAYDCGNGHACGTVFSLDPNSGVETVLHSFADGADGKYPEASLIAVNGTLYGTTYAGGHTGCGNFGCGTVFSVDANTGTEKVLYAFCSQENCTDGAAPFVSLIAVNGTLYGTTSAGGGAGCKNDNPPGCGTVFSIDQNTGAEKVIHSFAGGTDGANPYAGLLAVKGTLYGTTASGGAYGFGTVFVLKKNR